MDPHHAVWLRNRSLASWHAGSIAYKSELEGASVSGVYAGSEVGVCTTEPNVEVCAVSLEELVMAWYAGKLTPLRRNAFVFGKGEQKGEIHV